jgi:hypothetical protein
MPPNYSMFFNWLYWLSDSCSKNCEEYFKNVEKIKSKKDCKHCKILANGQFEYSKQHPYLYCPYHEEIPIILSDLIDASIDPVTLPIYLCRSHH